ncbi:peptidoglycan-binding protein [Streptomyces sp. NPDC002793]|uniref:peptidoglycan-binding protein n=1 Tax=Streptomyces sp. NPDC002793 TaxID=3154432 RepID=UPI003331208B
MSRWKELPAEVDSDVRQLVVRLRRLKDHSGLSTRQLAARTGYSPRSWERYLGAGSLPPREAVEALARIAGEDPTRLLVLHEVATEAWRAGGAAAPETAGPGPGAGAAPPGSRAAGPWRRAPRVAFVAGAVALVLAASAAVLLAVRHTDGGSGATAAPGARPVASTPAVYTCRPERRDGLWYAGNSRTLDAVVAYGHAGPEVAEAQCLLKRAGSDPGTVDGIHGPVTQRAVQRFQQRHGLVVDAIIGPHTWQALREAPLP